MDTRIGMRGVLGAATALGLATLVGCQPATGRIPAATGIIATSRVTAEQLGAPRVHLQTEYESFGVRRVRTRVRLEEDAFLLVVNVAPDGMARVVFPETPEDNGLLRGGQSYLLPGFFSGYPSVALETQSTMTRFVQVSRSIHASPMIHGPGYIFALASRTPFDMQRLEDEGFFDAVDFGNQLYELDPDHIIPAVAEIALWDVPNFIATTDVARYAGYDPGAGARTAFAYAPGRSSGLCPTYTMTSAFGSQTFFSDYGYYYPQDCLYRNPRFFQRPVGRVVPPTDSVKRPPFPGDSSQPPEPIWRRQGTDSTSGGRGPLWRRNTSDVIVTDAAALVSSVEANRIREFAPGRIAEDEIELTSETRERMLRRQRFGAAGRPRAGSDDLAPARPRTTTDGRRTTYEPGRVTRRSTAQDRESPREARTTRAHPARTEARPTRSEPTASPRSSSGSSGSSSSGAANPSSGSGSSSSSGSSNSGKRQANPD